MSLSFAFASHKIWYCRGLCCLTDGTQKKQKNKQFQTPLRKFPFLSAQTNNNKSAKISTKVIPSIQVHPSFQADFYISVQNTIVVGTLTIINDFGLYTKNYICRCLTWWSGKNTVTCSCDRWDAVSVFIGIIPCLCSRAGLYMSAIYWESTVVQLKIVTHWLQSNKLLSALNFFAFVPTPLRDNFLHFCSLKMPLEIMSECSKQLRLMLPYFSDKTGKGAVFSSQKNTKKTMIRCWGSLDTGFLWVVSWREVIYSQCYKAEAQ